VQFIDERGLELLRRWAEEEGVEVRGGSLFVRAMLACYGLG
jgi:hypothetical protein